MAKKSEGVPSIPRISRGRAPAPKLPAGSRTRGRSDGTVDGQSRLMERVKPAKGRQTEGIPVAGPVGSQTLTAAKDVDQIVSVNGAGTSRIGAVEIAGVSKPEEKKRR